MFPTGSVLARLFVWVLRGALWVGSHGYASLDLRLRAGRTGGCGPRIVSNRAPSQSATYGRKQGCCGSHLESVGDTAKCWRPKDSGNYRLNALT